MHTDFKTLLNKRKSWYRTIGARYCPALKELVIFNAKGFNHILYDGSGKIREYSERIERLHLLPHIASVISESTHYITRRKNKRVVYWSFEKKITASITITVIVRKMGAGNPIFYSVWKNNKKSL